ncbi:hypothetical protein D3C71_1922140 [compost metagenome]
MRLPKAKTQKNQPTPQEYVFFHYLENQTQATAWESRLQEEHRQLKNTHHNPLARL